MEEMKSFWIIGQMLSTLFVILLRNAGCGTYQLIKGIRVYRMLNE